MATAHTYATRVGVFRTRVAAERTVEHLKADGYSDDHIGLVSGAPELSAADPGQGAGVWAVFGALVGALAGAAVAAGAVPGVVPVMALGAAGTALLYAVGGMAVGAAARAAGRWRVGAPEAGRYVVTVDAGPEHDHPAQAFGGRGGAAPVM